MTYTNTNTNSLESNPILRLTTVTKQFAVKTLPAVSAVSLTLARGDLLALLGPSGCGKTTLLRLIAGFEQPQSGSIAIAGQDVAAAGFCVPPEKRGVGMVFQDYALFPHLTVSQNIAFGLSRKPAAMTQQLVREAIALVGLSSMENRYPHQLSGGQQQRVALARALAPHPFLVLLDEPLSNLDVQVRLRLRQELREILKAAGTTAIFVTHDQEEALSIADQVAVMREGCLEQVGTPEQIYRNPASRFVASFVTQANFVRAERQGMIWDTAIGQFPIEMVQVEPDNLASEDLTQVDLMVRQEDLMLYPDERSELVIRDRQFLGREYRYSVQLPVGQILIARTPADTALEMGTRVRISLAVKTLQAFPVSGYAAHSRTLAARNL